MNQRKNAIVTGAASGLGRAIAVNLARRKWFIALADVNTAGSQETLRHHAQAGGDGSVEELDVRHIDEWQALHDRLKTRWDHLDLLVNNAGVAGSGCVGEYSIENRHWIIDVNLWNGINGCQRPSNGSSPIRTGRTSSTRARWPPSSGPTIGTYNVTKAGMLALSETLQRARPLQRGGDGDLSRRFSHQSPPNVTLVSRGGTHPV